MKNLLTAASIFLLLIIINGCGGNEKPEDKKTDDQTMNNDQENGTSQMDNETVFENKEPVTPVSFKVLSKYLPGEINGIKGSQPDGETVTMGQWSYSHSKSDYNSDDGTMNASVDVMDYAYISALYAPYQTLFNMNYQRESSEGYERSTKIGDYPAFENWREADKSNELTVLVGKRFIVRIDTDGMPEGSAKKIAEGLNLSSLSGEKAD
jgi:hypothetical protein